MPKIVFMGAGSCTFAKNVLGDAMMCPSLHDSEIALYDIDSERLQDSQRMLENLNVNVNEGRAKIKSYLGIPNRKAALKGANYVINAIQVGRYKPSTLIDFEIPKKYKLRQTIADTLGIGGIFRALRTIPVMLDFAHEMERVCPDAWFINYTNPMAMNTGALLRGTSIRSVGLCHSVQGCLRWLLEILDLPKAKNPQWKIAGINHQAWLLEARDGQKDLYPLIRKTAAARLDQILKAGGGAVVTARAKKKHGDQWAKNDPLASAARDMIRLTLMARLGYYITESSEHSAEYMPYWIKRTHPELISKYNIPLDEYPRRCRELIKDWNRMRRDMVTNKKITHEKSVEYGSGIMEAIESGVPFSLGGSVMNNGIIPNLPAKAVVEVPCFVNRNGVQPCMVGDLPEQCAAMNRTNINVQILTIDAALAKKKDLIYQAAMMDPHTAAELSLDEIVSLCDDLIKAHGKMMPAYK